MERREEGISGGGVAEVVATRESQSQNEVKNVKIDEQHAKRDVDILPEIVKLNVGGKSITTTRSTLTKDVDSMLFKMFSR
jgi:DNA-binding protein YbaB